MHSAVQFLVGGVDWPALAPVEVAAAALAVTALAVSASCSCGSTLRASFRAAGTISATHAAGSSGRSSPGCCCWPLTAASSASVREHQAATPLSASCAAIMQYLSRRLLLLGILAARCSPLAHLAATAAAAGQSAFVLQVSAATTAVLDLIPTSAVRCPKCQLGHVPAPGA